MHYIEYVVNMQKALPKQPQTLIPDAVKKHQIEATLPKIKSLYHKTRAINPKNKCQLSRNDKQAEKLYMAGVRRVWFIANEQGQL